MIVELSRAEVAELIEFASNPNGSSPHWGRWHKAHAEAVSGGGIMLRIHPHRTNEE